MSELGDIDQVLLPIHEKKENDFFISTFATNSNETQKERRLKLKILNILVYQKVWSRLRRFF